MERGQTAERQRGALVVFFGLFFASAGGMGGTGGISFLEMILEPLEEHLNAIVGGLWDVVAGLGRLEAVTQKVVLGGQTVWAKLVGLLGIVQEQLEDLLAAAEEATRAIVCLVGSVEIARENA